MSVGVILVAAGQGRRFGVRSSLPKQFLPLNGHPLFYWSLRTFEKSPLVSAICVVVPLGHEARTRRMVRRWRLRKVVAVVAGGAERHDSVRLGMRALPEATKIVLVHDAARPLVTGEVVARVVAATRRTGVALAAWPVPDTLKEGNRLVKRTISRKGIWLAQTPQGFRRGVAERVLLGRQNKFTDDVQAAERMGRPVELVLGSPRNLKVTLPEDLKICKALLKL